MASVPSTEYAGERFEIFLMAPSDTVLYSRPPTRLNSNPCLTFCPSVGSRLRSSLGQKYEGAGVCDVRIRYAWEKSRGLGRGV